MCDKILNTSETLLPPMQLTTATQEFLEELMMEGDLLEVTLDETIYLWKILSRSRVNELESIHKKYKIPVSLSVVVVCVLFNTNFLDLFSCL